jgi:N-acetylmuramic acid 6-phosphate etherase
MNAADAQVPAAVASQAPAIARAITEISDRMRRGGRLIYSGAGTSGRLGVLDAAECPPTFSVPPGMVIGVIAGGQRALTTAVEGAEDDSQQGAADLQALGLTPLDSVMGIATSGRTPYVLGAVGAARAAGCLTLGLACNSGAALASAVDIMITPVVGPEIITGSTRLKAGTATKLVLNTLTTGIMVQLGKTLGNLMVDLRATNEKLQDRAVRIVAEITDLPAAEAAAVLGQCAGEVKTAVVVSLTGLGPEQARERLQLCDGHLRRALDTSVSNGE